MDQHREKIETAVAERLAPLLKTDGGSIEIARFDEATWEITVRFGGAYRGSPCRDTITKYVVEPILKKAVSEKIHVDWID